MATSLWPRIPALPLGDSAWRRRRPERSALYQVLAEHLSTYLEQAALSSEGAGIPWFVRRELRSFLSCGILAHGFARVRCATCRSDQLVAFSCKKRGFCPSCGARRAADTAAHLVDHVLPAVPVRQWVLTFPFRLRYLLAYHTKLCAAVRKGCLRTLLTFLRRRAARLGIERGQPGAVCSLQRAGGALNVNVHLHILALDGVFFETDDGLDFQRLKAPSESDVHRLLESIRRQVDRVLESFGLVGEDGAEPDDAGMSACLVQAGRARPARRGREPLAPPKARSKRLCAELEGYTLHADTKIPGGDPFALERLARYVTRPPVSSERLSLDADGQVVYRLRTPFSDGTSRLVFAPLPFIARLAAMVPPPRFHLVTYHGVLAPNHALRARVVPQTPRRRRRRRKNGIRLGPACGRHPWADLLRRVHAFDVLTCDRCGARKAIIATITRQEVIKKILGALDLPAEPPFIHPARSDPLLF